MEQPAFEEGLLHGVWLVGLVWFGLGGVVGSFSLLTHDLKHNTRKQCFKCVFPYVRQHILYIFLHILAAALQLFATLSCVAGIWIKIKSMHKNSEE